MLQATYQDWKEVILWQQRNKCAELHTTVGENCCKNHVEAVEQGIAKKFVAGGIRLALQDYGKHSDLWKKTLSGRCSLSSVPLK